MNARLRSIGLALLAPVTALVIAVVVTTLVIVLVGSSPGAFWSAMFSSPAPRIRVDTINQTGLIYIAAVAAAIAFRMGLFNIGLEGQYRLAAFAAASYAGAGYLGGGAADVVVSILIAMVVGAAWASLAAVLKVTRGVSEVISTIMLNAIAAFLVGYLLQRYGVSQGNTTNTRRIPADDLVPGWAPFMARDGEIWTLGVLAVLVGVGFWVLLNRTRFGFDLRASGQSATAALASGIDPKRMIVAAMALSGAVAGLTWLPSYFGSAGTYGTTFQAGLGFTGIAVALLGRNHPVGMAFGALLFAYLAQQSNTLTFSSDISQSIVEVVQGIAVLAVVIAYEVVRRWRRRLEQREFSRELTPAGGAA